MNLKDILSGLRKIRNNRSLTLPDFSQALVSHIRTMLSCSGCAVMLIEGNKSTTIAQEGMVENSMIETSIEPSVLAVFRQSQESIQENDTSASMLCGLKPAGRCAETVLCSPVIHDEVVVAVIYVDSEAKRVFSQEEVLYVEMIAAELSIAVQRSMVEARVKELSKMDGVTGCLNRNTMDDDVRFEIARANRYDKKFSFCLVEVGGLEVQEGQSDPEEELELLNVVVTSFRRNIRNIDKIYRVERKLFAILLPETDKIEAITVVSRLLEVIEKLSSTADGAVLAAKEISINIGATGYPDDGNSVNDLINAATTAISQAVVKGRNSLCVSGEGEPVLEVAQA
jgi:diguanylate cyclase (GGDEF)-like protein